MLQRNSFIKHFIMADKAIFFVCIIYSGSQFDISLLCFIVLEKLVLYIYKTVKT